MAARITFSSSPSAKTTRCGLARTRSVIASSASAVASRRLARLARVALQVGERLARHAAVHRRLGHGRRARGEISRGSKALGMMYSGPKRSDLPAPAPATSSGTSSRASSASASAAAIFIASLMVLARTSSAPRKMKGKPRTLLTWFG